MFERFTDRARKVLVLASDEAEALGHGFIGTEHILLGMLREGEGLAAKALVALGASPDDLRRRVTATITPGPPLPAGTKPPFTPRAKKTLELALREALTMNHNYIGTEHLLLGLIAEGEGVGAQVLVAAGISMADVRAKVIELLSGFTTPAAGAPGAEPAPTPAGSAVLRAARAQAGTERLGSHHVLLALVADPDSRAARVLASLGATPEAIRARLEAIGPEGTTDEVVSADRLRGLEVALGDGVTLRIDDAALADTVRSAITEAGDQAQPGELGAVLRDAIAGFLALRRPEPPQDSPSGEES
jgi:ATP-dependent Clp protease ATP-binding subunit ClpC